MSLLVLVLGQLLLGPAAAGLRCNTYIGTDVTSGGAGTESCPPRPWPAPQCLMVKYMSASGVRTYGMACDDFLQCSVLPANTTCCTTSMMRLGPVRGNVTVKCAPRNFNVSKINSTNFEGACRTPCR